MSVDTRIQMAIDAEIAWAAGLFEGEGTARAGTTPKGHAFVRLSLGMTDFDVVERFMAVVGCGQIQAARARREGWKPIKYWYVGRADQIVEVLEAFLPWLGDRRHAKAVEVLAIARTIRPHPSRRTHCLHGHAFTPENTYVSTSRDGHQSRHCKTCQLDWQKAEYQAGPGRDRARAYYMANREQILIRDRARKAAWYWAHRDLSLSRSRKWQRDNRERLNARRRKSRVRP